MAHFTCVGATVEELRSTLDEMRDAGIENVLALRGDPPQGEDEWTATEGGLSLDGINVKKEAIIQGQVLRAGSNGHSDPVGNAYVRLLDRTGEFTAEVPTSATGHFRFFAGPGEWTLRTLAPKAQPVDTTVSAEIGAIRVLERFSFVELPDRQAKLALERLDGTKLEGKQIRVEYAKG